MLTRPATRADLPAIQAIHRAAFGGEDEARLVTMLEEEGDALVSLVAGIEGAPVGHILFSRMSVEADGATLSGAALGPVGVLPHYQSMGLGSALIREGLARLRALDVQISFVLGHPSYYPRFGYAPALAVPFASPYAGPHFMALYLDSSIAKPQSGRADYAPAFARLGQE